MADKILEYARAMSDRELEFYLFSVHDKAHFRALSLEEIEGKVAAENVLRERGCHNVLAEFEESEQRWRTEHE